MSSNPALRRPNFARIIRRSGFECEKTWDRIIYGFKNGQLSTIRDGHIPDHAIGHCVVTLGTGTRSNIVWEGMEVLASHSYAVVGRSFHLTVLGLYICFTARC
jgi:hypothetical protein